MSYRRLIPVLCFYAVSDWVLVVMVLLSYLNGLRVHLQVAGDSSVFELVLVYSATHMACIFDYYLKFEKQRSGCQDWRYTVPEFLVKTFLVRCIIPVAVGCDIVKCIVLIFALHSGLWVWFLFCG